MLKNSRNSSNSSTTISRIIKLSPSQALKHIIEVKSLKNKYVNCNLYVNRNVNDDLESTKIDDLEISEVEQFSTEGKSFKNLICGQEMQG